MIISKYTDKLGKTNVSITVKKSMVKVCKNPDYVRITFNSDWTIGLDGKKQATVAQVFNLDNLVDNTKAGK